MLESDIADDVTRKKDLSFACALKVSFGIPKSWMFRVRLWMDIFLIRAGE
jgi:hypothetical protein